MLGTMLGTQPLATLYDVGSIPLFARLDKTPLAANAVFRFHTSATAQDAARAAADAARIGGCEGAFSSKPILEGSAPIPGLATRFGGSPRTPLPNFLKARMAPGGHGGSPSDSAPGARPSGHRPP